MQSSQSRQQSFQQITVEGTAAPHYVTSGVMSQAPQSSNLSTNNYIQGTYPINSSTTHTTQYNSPSNAPATVPSFVTRKGSFQQQQTSTTTTYGIQHQGGATTYSTSIPTHSTSYPHQSTSYPNQTTTVTSTHGGYTTGTTGGYNATTTSGVISTSLPTTHTQYGGYQAGSVDRTGEAIRAVSYQSGTIGSEARIVGREVGEGRLISVTERVDESRSHIINERIVEHEVRVPKKILREEIIEKVIVVPEKTIVEEIVDETAIVKEKIVEVSKPTIVEKVIEIPEIEYVERIVEVPQKVVQEKVREVEKVITEKRIVEIPKVVVQERVVEVPEITYRDVPVDVVVEVPEWRDEIVIKEVPITQYVEKPVPQPVTTEIPIDVDRLLPVPVEAEVTYEYRLPQLKPRYAKVSYPVYLPRFIEVPVAVELLNPELAASADGYLKRVDLLTKSAASLCEIENLAATIMKTDFQNQLQNVDLQSAVLKAWNSGSLQIDRSKMINPVMTTTTTTSQSHQLPYTSTTTTTQQQTTTRTAQVM